MPSTPDTIHSGLITDTITRILEDGAVAVLATLIKAPAGVGSKLIVESTGNRVGTLGNEVLDAATASRAANFLDSREDTRAFEVKEFAPQLADWAEAEILFERLQAEPRVVICGAGHVGAALARMASLMGYRSTLIDDRPEFVRREAFADENIDLITAEKWSDALEAAVGNGCGVSVAIVTRGHSEDEECLRAVLSEGGADYVGLIGSKRRTRIVLERLREKGITEEQLQRVRAPIGLDIGAVSPEEVALAIMAEIILVRRGGKGEPLFQRGEGKDEKRKGKG